LALPIKGSISFGDKVAAFVSVGVVPSLLLSARIHIPEMQGMEAQTIDHTADVSKIDIGALVEAGGLVKIMERIMLNGSLAYQRDFKSLTNASFRPNAKATHYGWSVSAGIKFSLGK
jgi:hypothetical protein